MTNHTPIIVRVAIAALLVAVAAPGAFAGHLEQRPSHRHVLRHDHASRPYRLGHAAGRHAGWWAGDKDGRSGRAWDAKPRGGYPRYASRRWAQGYRQGYTAAYRDAYARAKARRRWSCFIFR